MKKSKFSIVLVLTLLINSLSSINLASDNGQNPFTNKPNNDFLKKSTIGACFILPVIAGPYLFYKKGLSLFSAIMMGHCGQQFACNFYSKDDFDKLIDINKNQYPHAQLWFQEMNENTNRQIYLLILLLQMMKNLNHQRLLVLVYIV